MGAKDATKLSIDLAWEVATARGGECISKEYQNAKSKLLWRCSKGHEWWAKLDHVKNSKSWCPECLKLTIADAHEIAGVRGGECLSEVYQNKRSKLRWRCAEGHEWEASLCSVKNQNSWCPDCLYKNERACRATLEDLTGESFPKAHPDFPRCKRYPKGLELDGHCSQLNLAFEFNGRQHYEFISKFFHRSGEAVFLKQI